MKKWTIDNLSQRRMSISINCCHSNNTLQHSSCLLPYRSQSLTVSTPWSKEFNKNNSIWIQNLPSTLDFSHKKTTTTKYQTWYLYMPRWISRAKMRNLTFPRNTHLKKVSKTVRSRNGALEKGLKKLNLIHLGLEVRGSELKHGCGCSIECVWRGEVEDE